MKAGPYDAPSILLISEAFSWTAVIGLSLQRAETRGQRQKVTRSTTVVGNQTLRAGRCGTPGR